MQEVNVSAETRNGSGKGVNRKLRAIDRIPAVLYGHGVEKPINLTVDPKEMAKALQAIAKAQAAGEAARTEDYVQVWLPRVARVHFVVCLALLVSGPWLVGRDEVKKTVSAAPRNRALWWLTGLMIALSALMNYPRLSHSFWADEEWTARRFVVGDGFPVPPSPSTQAVRTGSAGTLL